MSKKNGSKSKKPDKDFVLLVDDDDANNIGFDWIAIKRLAQYLSPYKSNIILSMVAALLSVVANVAGPPIIGYVIDNGIENQDMRLIGLGVVAFLFVRALGALGFRFQILIMAAAGQKAIQALRDDLFQHINYLSISFFSKYETGRLIARVINDVGVLREAITFAVVGTFRDVLILVGILISMLLISPQLTVIAFLVLITLAIIANYWRIYARKTYLAVRETNSKVNSELSEAFNGVRVTQAFDRQNYNYSRFTDDINMKHREASVKASLVAALFFPSIELVGGVATGTLVTVAGSLVLNEQLTVFTLLTFVLYIDQFFFPIRMLAQRYNIFQSVMAASVKIFNLLDAPIDIEDMPNAEELPQIIGNVSMKNIGFSYDDMTEVLTDINLDIPAGQTVALVGHTGAGKSTFIKLILRFYDATDGQVYIDDYDVKTVTQSSLRRQMGVVLQEPYLFSGSIADNIRYGRLDASDEEVVEAAKAVDAHKFIMQLDEGYDTEVMEGGTLLSAGQKQLISFARALLADPRILILDEATSNIDTETEKIIQKALSRLLENRTSFVIAHRLSTIVNSDLILVMDHGQIIEQGNHTELLAKGGIYSSLYTMV